jgi:hypothetical protein
MLDPIQYEFRFFQNTVADPEPKLLYSGSGQKFRLRLRNPEFVILSLKTNR